MEGQTSDVRAVVTLDKGLPRQVNFNGLPRIIPVLLVYMYWAKRVIDTPFVIDTITRRRDTYEKNRQFIDCASTNCSHGRLYYR
jgi:hypothetical protein